MFSSGAKLHRSCSRASLNPEGMSPNVYRSKLLEAQSKSRILAGWGGSRQSVHGFQDAVADPIHGCVIRIQGSFLYGKPTKFQLIGS